MDFDFFDDIPQTIPSGGAPPQGGLAAPAASGPKGRKKIITQKKEAPPKKKPPLKKGPAKGKKKPLKKAAGAAGGGGGSAEGGGDDLNDFLADMGQLDSNTSSSSLPTQSNDFFDDMFSSEIKPQTSDTTGSNTVDLENFEIDLSDMSDVGGSEKKKHHHHHKKTEGDLSKSLSELSIEKKKVTNLDELDFSLGPTISGGANTLDDFFDQGGKATVGNVNLESVGGLDSNAGVAADANTYYQTSGCNEPEPYNVQKSKDKIMGFYISDEQGNLLFHREYMKQKQKGPDYDVKKGFWSQIQTESVALWKESTNSYQTLTIKDYVVVLITLNSFRFFLVGAGMYDETMLVLILEKINEVMVVIGGKKMTLELFKDTNYIGKLYVALDQMIFDVYYIIYY